MACLGSGHRGRETSLLPATSSSSSGRKTKAFPGHYRYIISPLCSGFAAGPSPSWGCLLREVLRVTKGSYDGIQLSSATNLIWYQQCGPNSCSIYTSTAPAPPQDSPKLHTQPSPSPQNTCRPFWTDSHASSVTPEGKKPRLFLLNLRFGCQLSSLCYSPAIVTPFLKQGTSTPICHPEPLPSIGR